MTRRHVVPLCVTATGYEPTDPAGQEQHAKFKPGTIVGGEIARSRSVLQHRRYWLVLTAVVDYCPGRWRTPEELHQALKVATGHIEIVQLVDGKMVKIPSSTAFDNMSQTQFQAYHDAAMHVIEDEILGGMSTDELLAHAETMASSRTVRTWEGQDHDAIDRMVAAGQLGG